MANANGGVIMKAEVSIMLVPLASFFSERIPSASSLVSALASSAMRVLKVGTEMNVVKEKSAVSLPRETITI